MTGIMGCGVAALGMEIRICQCDWLGRVEGGHVQRTSGALGVLCQTTLGAGNGESGHLIPRLYSTKGEHR